MTLDELAKYLGLNSTGSLRTQIRRGVLKAERVGNRTWIVEDDEARRYKDEHTAIPGRVGRPPKAPKEQP